MLAFKYLVNNCIVNYYVKTHLHHNQETTHVGFHIDHFSLQHSAFVATFSLFSLPLLEMMIFRHFRTRGKGAHQHR